MDTPNTTPRVGLATYAGLILTLLGAAGAVVAAIKANDVATVVAGASTIATTVATLGGRYAQAVALARRIAPVVEELAHGIAVSAPPPAPVTVNNFHGAPASSSSEVVAP